MIRQKTWAVVSVGQAGLGSTSRPQYEKGDGKQPVGQVRDQSRGGGNLLQQYGSCATARSVYTMQTKSALLLLSMLERSHDSTWTQQWVFLQQPGTGRKLTWGDTITLTNLRPDMVLISDSLRQLVALLELTIP